MDNNASKFDQEGQDLNHNKAEQQRTLIDNDTALLPLLSVYAHDTQNLWSGRCRCAWHLILVALIYEMW